VACCISTTFTLFDKTIQKAAMFGRSSTNRETRISNDPSIEKENKQGRAGSIRQTL
jgi:hypothetical protein